MYFASPPPPHTGDIRGCSTDRGCDYLCLPNPDTASKQTCVCGTGIDRTDGHCPIGQLSSSQPLQVHVHVHVHNVHVHVHGRNLRIVETGRYPVAIAQVVEH